jgi:hypothetical protein
MSLVGSFTTRYGWTIGTATTQRSVSTRKTFYMSAKRATTERKTHEKQHQADAFMAKTAKL